MQRRFRILVIDDESETTEALRLMLIAEGFEVVVAHNASSGLRAAYQSRPDAILLDIIMPDMDGFEACRRLREMTDAPIIFVTARTSSQDVVKGFDVGADDYVTKPYQRPELVSRLRANLRRTGQRESKPTRYLSPSPSIMLDCDRHELLLEDSKVYLAPQEYRVLELLLRHAGKVLTHDAILVQVWGPERIGEMDLIKQSIYRLRKKIEPDPKSPRYIHAVRGRGYYFEVGG